VKYKVPAAVTIAQWAVESAWGASMPPDSNNPFGIKAVGDQPAVESPTREVENGKSIAIVAKFRKFDSLEQAFDLHGKLLGEGRPYVAAMKLADDPEAFADALTGVYATDPEYGMTLKWVMKSYGLLALDLTPEQIAEKAAAAERAAIEKAAAVPAAGAAPAASPPAGSGTAAAKPP
jgi:flagellum-specific peptidoglycan hydrolase FlgJ